MDSQSMQSPSAIQQLHSLSSLTMSTTTTTTTSSMNLDVQMKLQPTINIGMIGHVAHGKSTLTKALSNVSTGRFHAEKEKGMTIRLGYANVKVWKCSNFLCPKPWCYRSTGSDQKSPLCTRPGCSSSMILMRHFSFIDAPGHHELMSTMLSGASVMDGALLVIAADEPCPCPQTSEHLVAAEIMGFSTHAVVVQNKVDLCSPGQCLQNQEEIKSFLKGTQAQDSPIIPLAARMGLNVDVLCQKLIDCIPIPKRDLLAPSRMLVIRSFDINKPGTVPNKLQGGVIGGSLLQGVLKVGEEIEIRPGIIRTDGTFVPIFTKVISLRSENTPLQQAVPGGLIAIGLTVDPRLCKGDRLVGQVAGAPGTLPSVFREADIEFHLLREIVGDNKPKRLSKPKVKDELLLCIGAEKLCATVISVNLKANQMRISFGKTSFACADVGSKIAIFRMESPRQWRLIGSGSLAQISPVEPSAPSHPLSEKIVSDLSLEDSIGMEAKTSHVEKSDDSIKGKKGSQIEDTESQTGETDVDLQSPTESLEGGCRMYDSEYPEVGDLVFVKITRVVSGVGAYCALLEYNDIEALISEKELSKKRLKSIKQVVRLGNLEVATVLRVDSDKGFIDLSKRRVEPDEAEKHNAWYQKSKTVDGILRRVSVTAQAPLKELYENLVWPMYAEANYDLQLHPLESFQWALHDRDAVFGQATLQFTSQRRDEIIQCLMKHIQHRLRRKPVRITAPLDVSCLASNGIQAISTALQYGLETFASTYKETESPSGDVVSLVTPTTKRKSKSTTKKPLETKDSDHKQNIREFEEKEVSKQDRKDKGTSTRKKDKKKVKNLEKEKVELEVVVETEKEKDKNETLEKKQKRVEVHLYLEASPLYTLSVVAQEKNEALNALNCVYRAICRKISELGGSASLAKPLQVLAV